MIKATTLLLGSFIFLTVYISTAYAGEILRFQNGESTVHKLGINTLLAEQNLVQDLIIQFKNPITNVDRAELKALGAEIFRYIPDDALVVRANLKDLQNHYAGSNKITGIGGYAGMFKISDNIPALSIFSKGQKEIILISAFKASDLEKILKSLRGVDADLVVINSEDRYLTLALDQSVISILAELHGVEFVQKVEEIKPLHFDMSDEITKNKVAPMADYTDLSGNETGTRVMNMDSIWSLGFTGQNQVVGMADTGLDVGNVISIHQDFQSAVVSGYQYGLGAKDWSDPMGHGTHVAGSVLGRGVVADGKLKGAAYNAKMVAQGMWSTIIDNLTVPPKLDKLFSSAYRDGARIHTNSWGAAQNFGAYDSMAQQVDDFMWKNPEMLILYAAGNSGCDKDANGVIDHSQIGTPATAKNTLSVGASENLEDKGGIQKLVKELRPAKECWSAEPIASSKLSDNINGVAVFSSRGPTKDGRLKPEIVAPGTNILSVKSQAPGAQVLWGEYSPDYVWSGGTSMATPLAAGAAAVAREFIQKKWQQNNPSAALVKALLLHTATDMAPGQYGVGAQQELSPRPNMDQGYGRVDMSNLAKFGAAIKFADEKVGLATNEAKEFSIHVAKASAKLLVNLVYTDAPGTPAAGQALVNNLDLIVSAPDGKNWGGGDKINNNEIVEIKDAKAGDYKITVKATNVPMGNAGKQPFAIVYSVF